MKTTGSFLLICGLYGLLACSQISFASAPINTTYSIATLSSLYDIPAGPKSQSSPEVQPSDESSLKPNSKVFIQPEPQEIPFQLQQEPSVQKQPQVQSTPQIQQSNLPRYQGIHH